MNNLDLRIGALRKGYLAKKFRVSDVIRRCVEAVDRAPREVWIHRLDAATLAGYAERLEALDPASLPLYGIPFVIKDNIDLAGAPTTASLRSRPIL